MVKRHAPRSGGAGSSSKRRGPPPPRRRSDASADVEEATTAAAAVAAIPEPSQTCDSAARAKNAAALSDLSRACLDHNASEARHAAWTKFATQGALSEVVWPAVVFQYSSDDKEGGGGTTAPSGRIPASPLLALLASVSHTQGQQPSQILSFLLGPTSNNKDSGSPTLEWTPATWKDCLTSMVSFLNVASTNHSSKSALDCEYLAAVTHFMTLLLGELNSSSALTAESQTALLWNGFKEIVMGPTDWELWNHLPPLQREFLFRKHGIDPGQRDTPTPIAEESQSTSKSLPFLCLLVRHILGLLESDDLRLGEIRFRQERETDQEQDDAVKRKIAQYVALHRALEFLLDVLSHPLLRPWVAPYLTALHVAILARRSLGTPSPTSQRRVNANLFLAQELVKRLDRSLRGSWEHETPEERLECYHRRAIALQKMCHRFYPDELPDLIYAGAGTLCQDSHFLRSCLSALNDGQLLQLLRKLRLMGEHDSHMYDRDFLQAVLEDHVVVPTDDPLQELQSTPLYATEAMLWDYSRVPPALSTLLPVSQVLSLPKLHRQFVGFGQYLSTNFELTQAASAYDIRVDLVDVIRRVRPLLRQHVSGDDETQSTLKTELTGWARMALEVVKFEITRVVKPQWGERHPSHVTADLVIDLKPCGDAIRREWDALGEFDNLFLVAIDASKQSGQPSPRLRDYHLQHGSHVLDSDLDRRIPDEDDPTFPQRFGVTLVRGCMILQVRDEQGTILSDPVSSGSVTPSGTKRIFRVALDPSQYTADFNSPEGTALFNSINLVVRRHGRENTFKAELETIRGLMAGAGAINQVLPTWLQPVILGHGDPSAAHFQSNTMQNFARNAVGVANPDDPLDFGDTFLNERHLRDSFGASKLLVDGRDVPDVEVPEKRRNYRIRITENDGHHTVTATSYDFRKDVSGNPVPFTPVQVEAIRSGLSPGLTMVIGPPGTGKTDVAVQIICCLFHSFPTQRTVVITHSNAALNDIFQKVIARGDVDERYLLRLGAGERDLETDSTHDFTKPGRVAYSFHRRGILLEDIQKLSESLGLSTVADRGADGSPSYTCETTEYFRRHHINKRIRDFYRAAKDRLKAEATAAPKGNVLDVFPFAAYFKLASNELRVQEARTLIGKLNAIFDELAEYRPLELLRTQRQRTDYLIMKQARVVAMTCTHAAMVRSQLIDLGFHYDNVVVEEAGQMAEIETFIPLLLQSGEVDSSSPSGSARLKRVCLMGDHNQLPPVIKNMTFAHYSNLDQSMFARLVQRGVSHVQLDKQGRARPEIARLYSWRYKNLGDLESVVSLGEYTRANAGFVHTVQLINVDKFQGKGEHTPTAYFYQNVGEAEYAVALFQYMVMIGYAPSKISILTTYNGQRALIADILAQRCGDGTPLAGVRPRTVSTVDKYQGQQNDVILLSMVRTESVGHVRDVRRLVVALSRSRLGLYVLCRRDLFAGCFDLKPAFDQLLERPTKLQLLLDENYPTERLPDDEIPQDRVFEVEDVTHLGTLVFEMQEQWLKASNETT